LGGVERVKQSIAHGRLSRCQHFQKFKHKVLNLREF
jgi:hypothetical protein